MRHVTQEVLVSLLNHVGPLPASDHAQDCLIQRVQLQTGAEHFLLERAGINQQEVMSHSLNGWKVFSLNVSLHPSMHCSEGHRASV